MFYYCVNSKNEGGLIKMAIKIMIADDHSMIREGLKSLLELEGDIQVVAEAEDGVDCLEKLKICTPDVLLLDINMPRKNGLEVLQTLKSSKSKVKVLVLTVHNEVEYLMKAVDIGVDGYILKDSESAELKKAIFSIVEGENYIQPSLIPALNSKMIEKNRDEGKIESLTKRELEVLKLLAVGMYNKEVAEKLNISERTVKNHVSNIFKKIEVTDRTQAAVFAIRNNLIEL
jgi:two-component system response regulator DegU